MKILVLSDNHGNKKIMEKIISKESDVDMIIHAGDHLLDGDYMCNRFDYGVDGNNDISTLNDEEIIKINDHYQILLCHGHLVASRMWPSKRQLSNAAKAKNCNIIIHGHTHVPMIAKDDGIHIFCPGALSSPRSFKGLTYGIMQIEDKNLKIEIKKV